MRFFGSDALDASTMLCRALACAGLVCAASLGGCAAFQTDIDDGGKAARDLEAEPPHDNDLTGFGKRTVPVVERKIDTPLGRSGPVERPFDRDAAQTSPSTTRDEDDG